MVRQTGPFRYNINHIAGKHLALTDYLSRNPVMKAELDDKYDEEYVINNIVPLYRLTANNGSLDNEHRKELQRMDQSQKSITIDTHTEQANGVKRHINSRQPFTQVTQPNQFHSRRNAHETNERMYISP